MIFCELWFLAFACIAVPAVWLTPAAFRRIALLAACVVFHAHYAGPAGMTPIIALAILTFFALRGGRAQRIAAIACSVGALVFYKYSGFIDGLTGAKLPVLAAPLAISFFVFEFVHLLTDRERGKSPSSIHPLDFSVFSIFFPSLASGPIKRFEQFAPELRRIGRPAVAVLGQSAFRILLGYFKKFVLGDQLAFEMPEPGHLDLWHGSVWMMALLLGLRIYLDFSGYSDIAIGFAGLFNIRLPENFSFPYLATDISEFWRRWHISLSTWIRDYVYIVLGGNRVPAWRRFGNLMTAMLLCGLWHGAAVHFGLWGLIQGSALLAHHLWRQHAPVRLPSPLAWALTFAFVQGSWLIFFYDAGPIWDVIRRSPLL